MGKVRKLSGSICDFNGVGFCYLEAKCPEDGKVKLRVSDHYAWTSAQCLGACKKVFDNEGEGWSAMWVVKAFRDKKNAYRLNRFHKRTYRAYAPAYPGCKHE